MKKRLGRYKIIKEIGRGAMGVVYQGYDPKIDRIVALKTIRKDRLAESRDVEDMIMRFQKEVRAAGKLVHPNIIVIYDTGEDKERAYIAMEYIEGDTLENLIQKGTRFPMEKIIDIIDQICDGLEYTHGQGIVHRDLKPSNIMLVQGEKVKITDFGISKAVGASSSPLTQAGILLGTPSYMSPEQIAGTEINGRSDLFSLGIILYQLLTGEKPFVGDTIPTLLYNIVNRNPTPPSQIDSSIPPLFDYVITKALAKDPDKRYRTTRDFVEDLKRARRGEALMEAPSIEPTMTVPQEVGEKIYPKRRRYGLLTGIAVLLLALVLGGYYWVHRTSIPTKKEVVAPLEPVKKFGSIEVKSDPPGAQVFLDGVEHTEPTPTVIEEVVAGEKHEIKVAKEGFKPWVKTVEPEDDKSLPIVVSLERLLTTIVIKSTPSGASVFLDGVEHTEPTPTVIEEVAAGEKHEIKVVKEGFKPWVKTVELEPDKSPPIQATLERPGGTIIVKSTPLGASVFLDNRKKSSGSTPTELADVSADDAHKITVMKKGYATAVQTVTLKPGERRELEVALKPLKGKLKIKVRPWARVYVDGKPMGMTPLTPLELPVGEHIVQVKNEKLREGRSFRVVVKPNEVQSLDVDLLKKE